MAEDLGESVELLHRVHVTDHKVECSLCHEPILHSMPDESAAAPLYCGSCHEDKHSGILKMFGGAGAKGVVPMPSPMYRAHVGCNGCHIIRSSEGGMGAAYKDMNLVAVRALAAAERALKDAEERLDTGSYDDTNIRRTMENARHNILFVKDSAPVHNRDYAVRVLEKTVQDLSNVIEKTR